MEIQIEIGTTEQKELIRRELAILERAADGADLVGEISRVIVPADFDEAVRNLTGDRSFTQNRGYHLVLAKVVREPEGVAILISPGAFTECFDTDIRIHYYVHELTHVGQGLFDVDGAPNTTERIYSSNLKGLFCEYEAERHALETCARLLKEPSDLYVQHHQSVCGSLQNVLEDVEICNALRQVIGRFRLRWIDMEGLQSGIHPIFDQVSKSLAYYAAYLDAGTTFLNCTALEGMCVFVTDSARELMRYFADKYEARSHDLRDGREVIRLFIETFGVRYEDTDAGLYCHVIGIGL
jgi:hypothetical protein